MAHETRPAPISRPLLLILATVFLNIMGLGLILPVLPFYATAYGADGAQVGLLFTAFSGLQFLASPIFGALSDRFGRRPIILLGILGQIIAYLMMGFATSLSMLFLSRVFAGATAGNISATQAYVADVTQPEDRTRAYGLVGAAFGAGLLFGPALGGGLTLIDPRGPAFGAAVLLALNLLLGFLFLSESLPVERRKPKPLAEQLNPVGVLVPLVRRKPLRGPLLATFLLNVALTGFQANFAVFADARFGFGPTEVSALFVATGLANILVQLLLVPRLSRRFRDPVLVLGGAAADAAGNIVTAGAAAPGILWGSLPVMTGGYSLSRGPLTSLITKLVAPYEQGLANGGVQATISLAGVVGPLWAGFAFEELGQAAPYWTSALAVLLAMLAIVWRTRAAPVVTPAPVPAQAQPPAAAPAQPAPAPLARMAPAVAPSQLPSLNGAARPELEPLLQGSLASLGLVPLLKFLSSANKAGWLTLWHNGWNGRLRLIDGTLVAAWFGNECGPSAVDAILLTLSEAKRFTFIEEAPIADEQGELAVEVASLDARAPRGGAGQPELLGALPSPGEVPRVVLPGTNGAYDPATQLMLPLGTLRTLLSIDGQRSVGDLAHQRTAQVLFDLATLLRLGLISFDTSPAYPAAAH